MYNVRNGPGSFKSAQSLLRLLNTARCFRVVSKAAHSTRPQPPLSSLVWTLGRKMCHFFQRSQDHVWATTSGVTFTGTHEPRRTPLHFFPDGLNDTAGFLLSLAFISHKTRSFPFESRSILSRVPHFRTRQVHCTKAQSCCSSKRSKFSTLPSWRKENKQTNVLSLNVFFTRRHRTTAILFHNLLEAEHSSIYTHFQSNAVIKVAPTPNYNWLQRVRFVDWRTYICTAMLHVQNWKSSARIFF